MYLEHFGLAQHPFSLTPNTRFFLKLPSHQQAFSGIISALREEGHFSKVIGEVGTGKTMLCRKVLNALEAHPDKFATAYIPQPILDEDSVMYAIAEELGLECASNISYYDLLKTISTHLVQLAGEKRRLILFIDEAQAMPEESLKAVYLLTQVKLARARRMHVILFGQPELDELLERNALQPVQDDIVFSFLLPALDLEGARAYVEHRLSRAGYCGPRLFTEEALEALFHASHGTPRLINILCNKSLMVAFGKGDRAISDAHMASAISDTESSHSEKRWTDRLLGQ
ncbi:MAG: AAA family ATPase [Pseudohongiellaceae bacterium]